MSYFKNDFKILNSACYDTDDPYCNDLGVVVFK